MTMHSLDMAFLVPGIGSEAHVLLPGRHLVDFDTFGEEFRRILRLYWWENHAGIPRLENKCKFIGKPKTLDSVLYYGQCFPTNSTDLGAFWQTILRRSERHPLITRPMVPQLLYPYYLVYKLLIIPTTFIAFLIFQKLYMYKLIPRNGIWNLSLQVRTFQFAGVATFLVIVSWRESTTRTSSL